MKSIFKQLGLFIICVVLFSRCAYYVTEHSIRVKNEYAEHIQDIKIGPASYGEVRSGETSDYKPVPDGTHSISGSTRSGQTLTGSIVITGLGEPKWMVIISSSGGIELKQE